MNEQEIRKIVRDEMQKNYRSGSPKVPPHRHNSIDNLPISQSNIVEFLPIPGGSTGLATLNNVSAANFVQNFIGNQYVYILPMVVGGVHGGFNGGDAPDGTLIAIHTGGGHKLAVSLENEWYGVDLSAL